MKKKVLSQINAIAQGIVNSENEIDITKLKNSLMQLYEKLTILEFLESSVETEFEKPERSATDSKTYREQNWFKEPDPVPQSPHKEELVEHVVDLLSKIPNNNLLLDNYNTNQNISVEEIINETCKMLEGTWALVIMCSLTPNKLYTTRKGSPILISCNKTDAYIVSEQSAFCGETKEYFTLKSNDIVTIEIQNNEIITKSFHNSNIGLSNTIKTIFSTNELSFKPYNCWLEKEIYEQVDSSLRAISLGGRLLSNKQVKLGGLEPFSDTLKNTTFES